jgi:hypothetical protein
MCATVVAADGLLMSTNAVPFDRPMMAYSLPDGLT